MLSTCRVLTLAVVVFSIAAVNVWADGPIRQALRKATGCCPPHQQPPPPPPQIIQAPPAAALPSGPDPTTIGMLSQVISNQGQILGMLGKVQGFQQAAPGSTAPAAPPYIMPSPQVAPIVYAPQPLPQQYAPQPLPQQYAPQPLPQLYQPQPLPSPAPQTLPHNYNPQIIVNPGGGASPGLPQQYAPQPLPGPSPQPLPRSGPPAPGAPAPGIDFRYYAPPNYMPQAADTRNGASAPPAPTPQRYAREQRLPRSG